jgi:hypothetical protein
MKLSIEIEDDKLNHMIQAQVGAAIAKMTDEVIKARIEEILNVKFARVTDHAVDKVLQTAADIQVKTFIERSYPSQSVIREALATAATRALKEARL